MKLIRTGYIIYFLFLVVFLTANYFSIGDLNSYFFWYFIELFLVLELATFVFKKLKLTVNLRSVYWLLLSYTIVNSLTLALLPEWRNLLFNRFGHVLSGVIFALIGFAVLKASLEKSKVKLTKPLFNLFVFSLASTAGVFNEIIELGLDYTTGSQRLGPGWDTAIDLLMNTLGILIIVVFVKKR
jgi:uncharacterized membrane protein YjdF